MCESQDLTEKLKRIELELQYSMHFMEAARHYFWALFAAMVGINGYLVDRIFLGSPDAECLSDRVQYLLIFATFLNWIFLIIHLIIHFNEEKEVERCKLLRKAVWAPFCEENKKIQKIYDLDFWIKISCLLKFMFFLLFAIPLLIHCFFWGSCLWCIHIALFVILLVLAVGCCCNLQRKIDSIKT